MSNEPFFICDCGSDVLAISHTWQETSQFEEVGFVRESGDFIFEKKVALASRDDNHEWLAYCGGCGKGVTVEWLPENRLRLLVPSSEDA